MNLDRLANDSFLSLGMARSNKLPAIKVANDRLRSECVLNQNELDRLNSEMQFSKPSPGIWAVGEQRKNGKPSVGFRKLEKLTKNRNVANNSVDLILINCESKLLDATLDVKRSQNFDTAPLKSLT